MKSLITLTPPTANDATRHEHKRVDAVSKREIADNPPEHGYFICEVAEGEGNGDFDEVDDDLVNGPAGLVADDEGYVLCVRHIPDTSSCTVINHHYDLELHGRKAHRGQVVWDWC